MSNDLLFRARELEQTYIHCRRKIHAHPEAGWQEYKTSALVREHLTALGIPFYGIGETAVVGQIDGGLPGGRCIGLRSDMDALPIDEQTGAEYASQVAGMMHACGHDSHTAILLGTAALLQERRSELAGKVKLFFQPAEEGPGGARRMIEAGCMEAPRVDAVLALHIDTIQCAAGQVLVIPGPSHASSAEFRLTVIGSGGHGARPNCSVDPIVAAAQIITALQTIASRETDPLEAVVVSIGTLKAGYRWNVIADQVEITGTIRALKDSISEETPRRIERIVAGICQAMRCTYEFSVPYYVPPVHNDEALAQEVARSCAEVLGEENVHVRRTPAMGGEDFSYFSQAAPSVIYRLGGRNPEKDCIYPMHHPRFNLDESAIAVGMATLAQSAIDSLKGAPTAPERLVKPLHV